MAERVREPETGRWARIRGSLGFGRQTYACRPGDAAFGRSIDMCLFPVSSAHMLQCWKGLRYIS
jgi:hypothetical protein